jgi:hypothetical protein
MGLVRQLLMAFVFLAVLECVGSQANFPTWVIPSEVLRTGNTQLLIPFFRGVGHVCFYLCNWPGRILDAYEFLAPTVQSVPFFECARRLLKIFGEILLSWVGMFDATAEDFETLNRATSPYAYFCSIWAFCVWVTLWVGVGVLAFVNFIIYVC